MDEKELAKLGKNFKVGNKTLKYGITPRLGSHIAERFKGMRVLETCTGAGFVTIELAKVAKQVITVDINEEFQNQAKHNCQVAGVEANIEFLLGDVMNRNIMDQIPQIDGAILDPLWNDLIPSNMSPPADKLFELIRTRTDNIALILPPSSEELLPDIFPPHELEKLYLDEELSLLCLYFGSIMKNKESVFKA